MRRTSKITGRVVDTKGEAAIGASILEKGTTNGTITDFDGNFKLTVGPKAVLQISYIGCKSTGNASSQQDRNWMSGLWRKTRKCWMKS